MHPNSSGYQQVNGLDMYYEIYGDGKPLVLVHGGGSTIQTSFGNIIPLLAAGRKVIAVEMQAHGRTADRDSPLSFAQDADDIAGLLHALNIPKADMLGFSNGGQTMIEVGLRHPEIVNKLIIASAFYKRDAAPAPFWEGFNHATPDVMPQALKDGLLAVNNNPGALQRMFNRDVERMKHFKGWTDAQIRSIQSPVLVMNSTRDVGSLEHAVEMYHNFQNAELVILPGFHGGYLGTAEGIVNGDWPQSYAATIITNFLD